MARIAGLILAGGRAARLGGINKALIDIGGIKLIDRVFDALGGCDPILLSVGSTAFPDTVAIPSERWVKDLPTPYGGPLAGVAAAVAALAESDIEILLSVAVDTPFFPADFAEGGLPILAKVPAVVGCFGGQDYPTNALWRMEALRELPARLVAGTAPHSLKRLAAGLGAARLDYTGLVATDPFANVNTPEDITAMQARSGR